MNFTKNAKTHAQIGITHGNEGGADHGGQGMAEDISPKNGGKAEVIEGSAGAGEGDKCGEFGPGWRFLHGEGESAVADPAGAGTGYHTENTGNKGADVEEMFEAQKDGTIDHEADAAGDDEEGNMLKFWGKVAIDRTDEGVHGVVQERGGFLC